MTLQTRHALFIGAIIAGACFLAILSGFYYVDWRAAQRDDARAQARAEAASADVKRNLAQARLRCVLLAAQQYQLDWGRYPRSLEEVRSYVVAEPREESGTSDPWGNTIHYAFGDRSKGGPVVTSAGPNGVFGDHDDIALDESALR